MRQWRGAEKRPSRGARPSALLCATPPMLREEQQREGPRRASKATSVPGDHKLVSKSQPNLQHTSFCEIPVDPISQNVCEKEECSAEPALLSGEPFVSVAEILPLPRSCQAITISRLGLLVCKRGQSCAPMASRAGKQTRT